MASEIRGLGWVAWRMFLLVRLRYLSVLGTRREGERRRVLGRGDTLCSSSIPVRVDVEGGVKIAVSVRPLVLDMRKQRHERDKQGREDVDKA